MINELKTFNNIQIADEDIICYSCFRVDDINNWIFKYDLENCLNVPILNSSWKINEINQVIHKENIDYFKQDNLGEKSFYGEWLYTFKKKNDAKGDLYFANKSIFYSHDSYVVCKCVIPKGSKYVEGIYFDSNNFSYSKVFASDKLKIVKVYWK